jgi:dTDP-4-amino-4,6-dideoxygalactose transaminase
MIRLGTPDISAEDIDRVVAVLSSGFLVQGREVQAFEEDIASLLEVGHVVAMSSCTTALEVALRSLGVGAGDTVITSSYSWVATANVIELVGARPIFVDIEPTTYNIDIEKLTALLSRLKRQGELSGVKAALPVHAFGYMADVDAITALFGELQIPVVEDAACALGATISGRYAGTFGQIGCFSFHPRKSITTGEGGVMVTNDGAIAEFARSFRNHGQASGAMHEFAMVGNNFRLTDVMAALGRSQLNRLPELLRRRRDVFELYLELLDGKAQLPAYDPTRHAAQSFVVRLPPTSERTAVIGELKAQGIEAGTGTVPIPYTSTYRDKYGYGPQDFPVLAAVAADALSLPLHSRMANEDATRVADVLSKALDRQQGAG